MDIFRGESIVSFFDRFKSDEDCLAYLAARKASQGYACVKCGHTKSHFRTASKLHQPTRAAQTFDWNGHRRD